MTYLRFVEQADKPRQKTHRWLVVGPSSAIGMVHWGAQWRKYVFSAGTNTYYDAGCLGEIAEFLSDKTFEHKHKGAVRV
jgi:hypothetical protein